MKPSRPSARERWARCSTGIHTNGLENLWSLLKRTLKGTCVSVELYHLFRHLDEQAFRFNERKGRRVDGGRFKSVVGGCTGRRLT